MADTTEAAPGTDAPAVETPAAPPTLKDSFAKLREAASAPPEEQAPEAPAADPDADDPAAGDDPAVETDPETKADEPTDDEIGEDDKPFVFKLPARREGEAEEEIEFEGLSREQREGLTRLRKEGLRRAHLNAELRKVETDREAIVAERAELQEIESALRADPAAFITARVKDPAALRTVAVDYLVGLLDSEKPEDKEAYEKFIEDLQGLETDPVRRENHRLKRQQQITKVKAAEKATTGTVDPEVTAVLDRVKSFVPAGVPASKADRFTRLALEAIHEHLVDHELETLNPDEIEAITAPVRAVHGFGPSAAGDKRTPAGSRGKETPATPPAAPDPRETGKRLATASTRRREAASTPAGGGAPPVAPTPVPKGGGIKEAIAALRNNG